MLKSWSFCLFTIFPLTFSQAKIRWNTRNTLHTQIRIWHRGVRTAQKFINIPLEILIIFKVISTTFSRTFDKNKPNVNKVKRKNGHVYQINLPNYREGKSHLILKNHYVRKFISLRYIGRNESSFIKIILNIWWKLTFLFQL